MDMATLIRQMNNQGVFEAIRTNPSAQFGPPDRRYLGATLLPEQNVQDNSFTETTIQYRTVVANDGTRYSPTQRKAGKLIGEFDVKLADQDIADEFSSRDYDALRQLLKTNLTMKAVANLTQWFDTQINRALIEKCEVQRWQAILDATVPLRGDNSYTENVAYSNPASSRITAAAAFTDNTVDPLITINERVSFLRGKGYTVNRIVASSPVIQRILNNTKFLARVGPIIINQAGAITSAQGFGGFQALNNLLVGEGLPPIERYDLQYRTMTGTQYFMRQTSMAFFATTGRDAAIDRGDAIELVPNTLGYHAIGRSAGQDSPGRVLRAEAFENKPPRIEAEGWQTALPVIIHPDAIAILNGV